METPWCGTSHLLQVCTAVGWSVLSAQEQQMISHRRRRLSFVSSSAQEPRCPPASLEPEMLSNRFQCRAFCWLAIKYCTNAVRRVPTRCENKQPASSVVVKYCTNTTSASNCNSHARHCLGWVTPQWNQMSVIVGGWLLPFHWESLWPS